MRRRRPEPRWRGCLRALPVLMCCAAPATPIAETPLAAPPLAASPFAHLYDAEALHAPGEGNYSALRTDDAMIALLKSREKLRLWAFRGASGMWLIGYGHARTARPGLIITEREAERLLRDDLLFFEAGVKKLLTRPVRQREFSAMVDLAYNAGLGAFASSSVLRRFNAGDRRAAADALLLWRHYRRQGRLVPSRELAERRRLNRAHFLGRTRLDAMPKRRVDW